MTTLTKRLRNGALILFGLPVLLLAAIGLLHTPAGERWLAAWLGDLLSSPERSLTIDGLRLRWPLEVRAERIELADRAGPWLVLHQAALDWSPGRLSTGVLAVQQLTVDRAELRRAPMPTGTSSSSGMPSLPRLPLILQIDHVAAGLSISPTVTGTGLELLAAGHARAHPDLLDVALDIRHVGARDSEAHARLSYDRDTAALAVDMGVARPVAEVLVRLAGVADQIPAMDIKLTGGGPLSDWRGTVSGGIAGRNCLDGTLRVARSEGLEVSADIGQAPECLPDPAIARLLAGAPIALRANVTVENGRLTRIAEARLRSAALRVGLSGTLEDRLGIRFSVETGELERFGALAGIDGDGSLQATGTITGSLAEPVIEAKLLSASGRMDKAQWRDLATDIQFNPAPDGGWMAGTTGSVVAIGLPVATKPVSWSTTVHFDRAGALYRLVDLRLTGLGGEASLFGTVRADGPVALRGLVRSGRLATFRELAGLPGLSGQALAHLTVSGDHRQAIAATIFAGAAGFASGVARLDPLLGATPRFTATAVYRDGTVPLLRAVVVGDQARLVVGGKAFPTLGLGWRLDLPDLATLSLAEASGQAVAHGFMTGPTSTPHLAGLMHGRVTRLEETFELLGAIGAANLAAPAGAVHLGLRDDDLTAELTSRFSVAQGLEFTDLSLFSQDARVTGDLAVAAGGIKGHLTGRSSDLRPWSRLAGVALSGSVAVDARLSHDKRQSIEASLNGVNLQAARFRIGQLNGRLAVTDALGEPRGTARLEASQLVAGGTTLRTVDIRAEATGQTVDLRVNATAQDTSTLAAQGSVKLQGDTQTVHLASLVLKGGGLSGRLLAPTTVVHSPDDIRISPTRLDIGGGRIELSGQVAGQALDLRLALVNTPVRLIEPYLSEGQRVVGTLNATARVLGTVAAPVVTMDAAGQGLGLAGAGREHLDVTVKARWQDRQVELDARAKGTQGTTANVEGRLPLLSDLSIPDDGSIRGRARGNGDLGRLSAALPLSGHRVAGKIAVDVSFGGTVAQPAVSGQATLREGFYEFYETGTRLRDLEATLTARDSRSFALNLSGSDDRRKGRIYGDGKVNLQGSQPAWDMALTMSDVRVIDLDATRAQASGQLAFNGQGTSGRLSGKLQIGPTQYQVTDGLFGGGVPRLDVVEVNRPAGRSAGKGAKVAASVKPDAPKPTPPVDIALAIEADVDRLIIRGQGLQSDWQGQLSIGGTANQPAVTGSLEAVRGSYEFLGKRFELVDSRVTFDGGAKIDPALDITAEAEANDITAQVKIGGLASKPDLEFASVPSLPSDEVLARLLFGKSVGQLSVAQQVQIARAAASLTGGSQYDPVALLRGQLGLDLLDVGVAEEGSGLSPNVTVGKYIDRDTFVRVEEGLGSNEEKVTIERRLGRGLSVEADVGRRGSGGVGLSWRTDY